MTFLVYKTVLVLKKTFCALVRGRKQERKIESRMAFCAIRLVMFILLAAAGCVAASSDPISFSVSACLSNQTNPDVFVCGSPQNCSADECLGAYCELDQSYAVLWRRSEYSFGKPASRNFSVNFEAVLLGCEPVDVQETEWFCEPTFENAQICWGALECMFAYGTLLASRPAVLWQPLSMPC